MFDIRPDVDHGAGIVGLVDGDRVRDDVLFEFDDDKVLDGGHGHVLTHNLVSRTRATLPPPAVRALCEYRGGGRGTEKP